MRAGVDMQTLKKIMLIIKIGFLSVFGTTQGLANVEKELAFITGTDIQDDPKPKQDESAESR